MPEPCGDSDLDSRNSVQCNSSTIVNDSQGRNSTAFDGIGVPAGEKIAVKFENKDFTASQLLDDAKRLAAVLSKTDLPVVILLPRGYWLYVSQLAVWLQGGFFVPVDTRNPVSRIEFLLQDSQTQTVLTDQANAARLVNASEEIAIIDVEQAIASQLNSSSIAPTKGLDRIDLSSLIPHQDNDFVYMIYTSGSTGRPKGVPIHWKAMDNQYQWFVKQFGVGPHDHCMQISSPGFDISIEEIWGSLQTGATLHVPSDTACESAEYFWQWVEENRITILDLPTALWQAILPALATHPLPEPIRLAIIGGEAVSPTDVELWFSAVDSNKVRLVDCYGPTETTITSTFCELKPSGKSTIGKPIDNMQCFLVDESGQKIQHPDQIGEIYLSGDCVAQGYWNRPDKTAEAFSNHPACDGHWAYRTGDLGHWDGNGDLVFCGRRDAQVKLRGYRIELGEIETAIREHPQVKNCVVKKIDLGSSQLVAFVCTEDAPDSTRDQDLSNELTRQIASGLPEYMIPSRFCFMQDFPLTSNNKIDHAQLEKRLEIPQSTTKPTWNSQLKNTIGEAWKVATGHYPENDDQPFVHAGGDSLGAISLITELRRTYTDLRIGSAVIGSQASLNSIAEYIESQAGQSEVSPDRPLITVLKQSNVQSKRWLLLFHPAGGSCMMYESLLTDKILNEFMVAMVESPYLTGPLPANLESQNEGDIDFITANYANAIKEASSNWSPATQIITAGYSLGGIMAYEVARLFQQSNLPVDTVINIDQPVPSLIANCSFLKRLVHWSYRLRQPVLAHRDLQKVRRNRMILDVAKKATENQDRFSEAEIRSMQLEDYYCAIESEYQPQRSDLSMELIRGGIFEAKHSLPDGYGWSGVVKSLTVHQAHGTHSTIIAKPNMRHVQRLFSKIVEPVV